MLECHYERRVQAAGAGWLLTRHQRVGGQGLCPSRAHQGLRHLGWEGLSDRDLIEPGRGGGQTLRAFISSFKSFLLWPEFHKAQSALSGDSFWGQVGPVEGRSFIFFSDKGMI